MTDATTFEKEATDVIELLTKRVGELLERVNVQSALIQEHQASIEDLMSGSAIATTYQPEIRVRIGHTHTLKDGWRCDSTTVEWTGRGAVDWDLIRTNLTTAHSVGEIEANERHALAS